MRRHPKRPIRPRLFALLAVLAWTSTLLAQAQVAPTTAPEAAPAAEKGTAWEPVWEHWHTLAISGATAGWVRETVSSDGERYRSAMEMNLKISRGPIEIEIEMSSDFFETHDGRPIELHFVQDMSIQSVDTRWLFNDDHVLTISKQGGREVRNELPLPAEPWLTPMAAHRYMMERVEAGAETIEYKTVDGEAGLEPVQMKHVRKGDDEYEFGGRTLPVTVWHNTSSAMPGVASVSMLSSDGHVLFEEVNLPFGTMTTRAATRAEAMAAGAAPAPELMVTTFVKVERPIERARSTSKSTLRLRIKDGELPELPSAGAQRAEVGADRKTALLKIDTADNLDATDDERNDPSYLKSSAMTDLGDAMIEKLAASAVRRAGDDPTSKAEAMRRFVHRHISAKALDTAFATASETARMKTGDCSEHGVLLCALLRSQGIPSRVATGLIYADYFAGQSDIFGWHMWTQALIDGKWVDLDATLAKRYDAVHVLIGTSSLADGVGASDLNSMLLLLGNLDIEVVEVGYD